MKDHRWQNKWRETRKAHSCFFCFLCFKSAPPEMKAVPAFQIRVRNVFWTWFILHKWRCFILSMSFNLYCFSQILLATMTSVVTSLVFGTAQLSLVIWIVCAQYMLKRLLISTSKTSNSMKNYYSHVLTEHNVCSNNMCSKINMNIVCPCTSKGYSATCTLQPVDPSKPAIRKCSLIFGTPYIVSV